MIIILYRFVVCYMEFWEVYGRIPFLCRFFLNGKIGIKYILDYRFTECVTTPPGGRDLLGRRSIKTNNELIAVKIQILLMLGRFLTKPSRFHLMQIW